MLQQGFDVSPDHAVDSSVCDLWKVWQWLQVPFESGYQISFHKVNTWHSQITILWNCIITTRANNVFIQTGVCKIHFTPSKNMKIGGTGQQPLSLRDYMTMPTAMIKE